MRDKTAHTAEHHKSSARHHWCRISKTSSMNRIYASCERATQVVSIYFANTAGQSQFDTTSRAISKIRVIITMKHYKVSEITLFWMDYTLSFWRFFAPKVFLIDITLVNRLKRREATYSAIECECLYYTRARSILDSSTHFIGDVSMNEGEAVTCLQRAANGVNEKRVNNYEMCCYYY